MDPKLSERYSSLSSQLSDSPTAQPGQQMPSMGDIRTEQQMKKTLEAINIQQDKALRENWYGTDDKSDKTDSAPPPTGLFQRTINALSAPLMGVVGAIDYATGQSRGSSLGDAINKNVSEDRRLFGDVLKGAGLPGVVAKPVGLTADIVLDPINIITAGTGGIIARMFAGGVKGASRAGLRGAAQGIRYGAESRALETALVAKNLTLGGTKLALKTASLPVSLFNKFSGRTVKAIDAASTTKATQGFLEKRAVAATKKFDDIMGTNAIERAIKDDWSLGSYFYEALEQGAKKVGDRVPVVKDFFQKYLSYDNAEWSRVARIKDALLQHSSEAEMTAAAKSFVKTYDKGGSVDDAFAAAQAEIKATPADFDLPKKESLEASPFEDPTGAISMGREELNKFTSTLANKPEVSADDLITLHKVAEDGQEAVRIASKPDTYVTFDPLQNQYRLFAEATNGTNTYNKFAESLRKMIQAGDSGHTGVAWWDNMRANVNQLRQDVKDKKSISDPNITIEERVGEKTAQFLDVYSAMLAVFKRAKVAASPRAWTNSILGNLAMAKLNGIDVLDPAYSKAFRQSLNVVTGKSSSELLLNELAEVSDLIPMVKSNPSQFELTTGLSRDELVRVEQLKNLMGRFKKVGIEGGVLPPSATNSEVLDAMEKIMRAAGEGARSTDATMFEAASALAKASKKQVTTVSQRKLASIDAATGEAGGAVGTDLVTNEFFDSQSANKFFKKLADGAKEEGNYAAQLGNLIFNKMPDGYSKIDSVYKLSNVVYTSKYGVKEHELRQIARAIKLDPEDVEQIVIDGVTRYRFTSAAKSFELANETFLNYNAMPAAVKVIRQMPLVGAPFIAFTYGMYGKVLKGLVRNPAFFTKQSFALQEMSAEESPVEKALLAMERYSYLNDPAMVKLPFPGNSMIYVNAANVLPYLSLSLVQPSSRAFEEVLPNAVAQAVDKSPILKDPIGSMIFDYFVLPALLSEEVPLGAFGQPLYPRDAGLAEKIMYAGRTAADAFVPGIVEPVLGTVAPASTAPFLPGYTTRKTAFAKEGKTPVGVQSKEHPLSRWSRSIGGSLGVPIQTPVPHAFLDEDEIADKLNQ